MRIRNARLIGRTGLWDIVCDHGNVVSVTPSKSTNPQEIDSLYAEEGLVTPAFADVHMHLDKAFNAEITPNKSGTLDAAIRIGAKLKAKATKQTAYEKILRGAQKALEHGTTRIRTHVDVDPIAKLTGVEAALEAKETLKGLIDLQIVAFPQEGILEQQGVIELLNESLTMGCDIVGGIPSRDSDPKQHIREVFELAQLHDVPVDMHVDESDDPTDLTILECVDATLQYGYSGRVTASHCCSLSAQDPERRESIIEQIARAGVHVVTLPSTNLYLQGRGDAKNQRRGLTPVKELLSARVNVAYGSDNIRDPFNPFGNANMNEIGLILAHAAHMGGTDEIASIFDMATWRAGALMDSMITPDPSSYTVAEGIRADLLLWDRGSSQEIMISQSKPTHVIVAGKVVVKRREIIDGSERLSIRR